MKTKIIDLDCQPSLTTFSIPCCWRGWRSRARHDQVMRLLRMGMLGLAPRGQETGVCAHGPDLDPTEKEDLPIGE